MSELGASPAAVAPVTAASPSEAITERPAGSEAAAPVVDSAPKPKPAPVTSPDPMAESWSGAGPSGARPESLLGKRGPSEAGAAASKRAGGGGPADSVPSPSSSSAQQASKPAAAVGDPSPAGVSPGVGAESEGSDRGVLGVVVDADSDAGGAGVEGSGAEVGFDPEEGEAMDVVEGSAVPPALPATAQLQFRLTNGENIRSVLGNMAQQKCTIVGVENI